MIVAGLQTARSPSSMETGESFIDLAHSGSVVGVQHIIPDGPPSAVDLLRADAVRKPERECVASAGADGLVKIWHPRTFKVLGFLFANSAKRSSKGRGALSAMLVPRRSGIVVLGFTTGLVESWGIPVPPGRGGARSNARPRHHVASLSSRAHGDEVTCIEQALEAQCTASRDCTIRVWSHDGADGAGRSRSHQVLLLFRSSPRRRFCNDDATSCSRAEATCCA